MRLHSLKQYVLIFVSISILTASCTNQQAIYQNVNAQEFKTLMDENDGTLLDVRTKEETDAGYIEGAVFLDFYFKSFEARLMTLNKDKPVYVYCRSGGRSSKTATMLIENGFTQVYNLDGGFNAWKKKGFEVAK